MEEMKKYKIGYTQGTFDMFHIGHLNLLNNAKKYCEYLIVGVNTDCLVKDYKEKVPVVGEKERLTIIENIKSVDKAVLTDTLDKMTAFEKYHFDAVFIGDDWKGSSRWKETEEMMKEQNVDVIFLPHTKGISSTILRDTKDEAVGE